MMQKLRKMVTLRVMAGVLTVAVVGGLGSYFLASSNAQTPLPLKPLSQRGSLHPYSLGTAPYQYVAYSGSVDATRAATGMHHYFAAFVINTGTCTPSWGGTSANGLTSKRSAEIAADFTKLRASGGEVAVSFGGSDGTELASSCQTADSLASAYRNVIETYGVNQVDFDIEGAALADAAGTARRAEAIAMIQKTHPSLKVWVTLPVHAAGLTPDGERVLTGLRDAEVDLSGVNIMAMNYNIGSKDMGKTAIAAAEATTKQLRRLYPQVSPTDVWKTLGITVMAGKNNTVPETFTLEDAAEVRQFALQKGVGMLSYWNAGRDTACPEGAASLQPSTTCSGIPQQPYDFVRALTIPALP
jgi:hypothetical protein